MCAVVTVGAVVGATCGACAARAWRWSTACRRVPKRCAPKSWGLFSTKIINRAIFACFAPRKQVRVCKFHSFGDIFCFLLYTRAQKRASPTALAGGMAPQVGEHGAPIGRGAHARGEAAEPPPHRASPHIDVSLSAPRRHAMLGASPRLPPPSNRDGRRMVFEPNRFFCTLSIKDRYFTR